MLTEKEIKQFQELLEIDLNCKVSYDHASKLAHNFCALMLLLLFSSDQQYPRLLIETPITRLE